MRQNGEILTLFAIILMFVVGVSVSELRDHVYPIKCKTSDPEIKCEIYRGGEYIPKRIKHEE